MSTTTTTIQIGDGGGAYTFDVPPEFAPQITTLRNDRGERIGERHVWPVRGYLRGAGPDNINTLWNALKTKLQTEQVNVYFKHGETTLQQLLASDAERGPKFDGPSIESGDETAWDSNLLFSFEITADIYDTQDGVIDVQYSITYRQNEDGSYSRTKSGTVTTKYGTSAHTAALTQAPSVPSNYKLTSASVTPSDDDTEADFTYVIQSLFSALPDQVLIAERVVDESVENGVKTTTYRATFTGPGATRAAEEFRPEGTIVGERTLTAEDDNSVSVTYTVQESADQTKRLRYFNSTSIQIVPAETDEFPLDSAQPILFSGAQRATTIVEDGYEICSGEAPPAHPALNDSRLVLVNKTTSVRPWSHDRDGNAASYIRTWNYTYKSSEPFATDEAITALEANFQQQP